MAKGRFSFLGETRQLPPSNWSIPNASRLWLYNLHYFDDLNAKDCQERVAWHRELLIRWTLENPVGVGVGWEPYPTSLRIVNWIKWSLAGNILPNECIESLAIQARWLSLRLEKHLLGNHLFSNAKALVFVGLFFSGREADKWLATGLSILEREVPEQILKDGGHFELSTMYHLLALEDLLDLFNLVRFGKGFLPAKTLSILTLWKSIIPRMIFWAQTMIHPDGEISFFNDAAFGIAPSPHEIFRYAERLGFATESDKQKHVTRLSKSGYIRVDKTGYSAILDTAKVGPDYLPGHAHADTLSFELSIEGYRVFVNSGTSCYEPGEMRDWERSTAAHNTVEIDNQSSSEIWGGFRVARRAYPRGIKIRHNNQCLTINASHDGYLRLPGKNLHKRQWQFKENSLIIEDSISGFFSQAIARLFLHPQIRIVKCIDDTGTIVLCLPNGKKLRVAASGGAIQIKKSLWRPCFGVLLENHCLVVNFLSQTLTVSIFWHNNEDSVS